jgi:hypothetical protein
LKSILDVTARSAPQIILSEDGRPYTSSGLTRERAGLKNVEFRDLRGTAVTRLAVAGATEIEIAAITGHSISGVKSILDQHYLSRVSELGESAIRKLESRTKIPN